MLRTGFMVLHQRPKGGVLFVVDRSRLAGVRVPGAAFPRISLYYATLYRKYALPGVTVLQVVTSAAVARPAYQSDNDNSFLVYRALAGRKVSLAIVVAQAYEPGMEALIDYEAHSVTREEQLRSKLHPERIVGSSFVETLKVLEKKGLERDFLPRCLGGNYDYRQFDEWIRARLSMEGAMTSASVHALSRRSHMAARTTTAYPPAHGMSFYSSWGGSLDPATQALAANMLRARIPVSSSYMTTPMMAGLPPGAQSYPPFFTAASTTALVPAATRPTLHWHPVDALAHATAETTAPEPSSDKEERKPKKIRTYQRRNTEIERLKGKQAQLESLQEKLVSENRRLEHWLAQARLLAARAEEDNKVESNEEKHDNDEEILHVIP